MSQAKTLGSLLLAKQNKQAVRHHPDEQTARLLSQRSCPMNMWKGMTVAAPCTCVSTGQVLRQRVIPCHSRRCPQFYGEQ
eukprot:scaffold5700_cov125-Skeletonema_marinoi.AAC.1